MQRTAWTCISLRFFGLVLLVSYIEITSLTAQSHFYNSQQYGLKSTLLGGAVTSGDADLSMAYYNPGALHLAESRVAISLIKPEISNFGIGSYFGADAQNKSLSVSLSPSLVSYNFIRSPSFYVSFITLRKSAWDYDISSKSSELSADKNLEQIFEYRYKGSDNWYGFSSSYKINRNVGIGLSQFISSSGFEYENVASTNKFDIDRNLPYTFFSRSLNTNQSVSFSMVSKVGLHLQFARFSLGLVVKTPNYLSTFKGGYLTSQEIVNISGRGSIVNIAQFDLNPDTRTPWEFNLGGSLMVENKTKLWANISHYSGIDDHSLSNISTIDNQVIDWRHEQKSISNFSVGVSNQVNDKVQVIASFRTNFMAYENVPAEDNIQRQYLLDGDRYHFTLGTNLNINRSAITVGLDFAFANRSSDDLFRDFPNIGQLVTDSSRLRNETLTLLFTYEFLLERFKTPIRPTGDRDIQ